MTGRVRERVSPQLLRVLPTIVLVFLASLAPLAFVVGLYRAGRVSFSYVMRDPAVVARTGPLIGFLSNLGIVVWAASAAICLFSALVMDSRGSSGYLRPFLLGAGSFTLLLMLDDLYMLHEVIIPTLLGVPEDIVVGVYGLLLLGGLIAYSRSILRTDFLLLGMALGFFALSIAMDLLLPYREWQVFCEDGAKFIGIVSWLACFAHVSAAALRSRPAERVWHHPHEQPVRSEGE